MQVPPRSLERKSCGVTAYSKLYRDPFRRKQSRQVRTTPLLGFCRNPQSGNVGQDEERENNSFEEVSVLDFVVRSGVKWTTLLPPT